MGDNLGRKGCRDVLLGIRSINQRSRQDMLAKPHIYPLLPGLRNG